MSVLSPAYLTLGIKSTSCFSAALSAPTCRPPNTQRLANYYPTPALLNELFSATSDCLLVCLVNGSPHIYIFFVEVMDTTWSFSFHLKFLYTVHRSNTSFTRWSWLDEPAHQAGLTSAWQASLMSAWVIKHVWHCRHSSSWLNELC